MSSRSSSGSVRVRLMSAAYGRHDQRRESHRRPPEQSHAVHRIPAPDALRLIYSVGEYKPRITVMVAGTVADAQDAPGLDVGYESLDLVADLVGGPITGPTVEGWKGRSASFLFGGRSRPARHHLPIADVPGWWGRATQGENRMPQVHNLVTYDSRTTISQ